MNQIEELQGRIQAALERISAGTAALHGKMTQEERNAEAARLLEEAGYGADNPLEFNLLYNTSENHKKLLTICCVTANCLFNTFKNTITTIDKGKSDNSILITNWPIKLGRQFTNALYFSAMIAGIH